MVSKVRLLKRRNMDKQKMAELLLGKIEQMKASQEEMKADINDKAAARREEADAKAAASLREFKGDIEGHVEALLHRFRSCGKGMTA
jgi:hypothetical protein